MMRLKNVFYIFFIMLAVSLSLHSTSVHADDNAIDALFKKGITFETRDGNYSLTISPRIQIRYAYDLLEGSDNDAHSLMIRRAYLTFEGHAVTKNLKYYLRINMLPGSTANNVLHYSWLNYSFVDEFQLQAGLLKLPFNRQEMTSSGKLQFVDRSLANERFNLDRSIAFVAHGEAFEKQFEYYLTVANGRDTRSAINVNQELAYVARLVWNPLGEYGYEEGDVKDHEDVALTFGVAGELHHEETTVSINQDRVLTAAADMGIKYRGFSLEAGGFYRNTDPGAAFSSVNDIGYYVQAGYFFIPKKLEFALRASSLFDDLGDNGGGVYFSNGSLTHLGGANDAVDEGADSDNEHEYSAVVNYYFKGHDLKLQTQYTYMLDGVPGSNDVANHVFMTQVQLQF